MLLALAMACQANRAVWAYDPILLPPQDHTPDRAWQTWNLYQRRWQRSGSERAFLCALVVELRLEPGGGGCTSCEHSWAVQPSLLETDCAAELAFQEIWTNLQGLGLGALDPRPEAPYPGDTWTAYADYGYGWEVYGYAYPEALDYEDSASGLPWTGKEAFRLLPEAAWPLEDLLPGSP